MTFKLLSLLSLFLAICTATSIDYSQFNIGDTVIRQGSRCGEFCAFRFCKADGSRTIIDNAGRRIVLRDAGISTNPFVCARKFGKKNKQVKVKKTGEALVHPVDESPDFVRISQFKKGTVSPKFSKKYFTLKEITKRPPLPGEFGVARLMSKGNQEKFVNELCVVLPIKNYDILKKTGKVQKRIKNSKLKEDCISFQTTAPKILIELTWQSADDIDVRVEEPDGNVIAYFDLESKKTGGVLTLDQNVGRCGEDSTGREQITWKQDDTPLEGTYNVQVRHFSNCGDGPTKWTLAVVIDGKLVNFESGSSNADDEAVIKKISFDYKN